MGLDENEIRMRNYVWIDKKSFLKTVSWDAPVRDGDEKHAQKKLGKSRQGDLRKPRAMWFLIKEPQFETSIVL